MTKPENVRRTIVKSSRIYSYKKGDSGFPPEEAFDGQPVPDKAWRVSLTVQTGLLPEYNMNHIFENQREAENLINAHPVGSEYDDGLTSIGKDFFSTSDIDFAIQIGWTPSGATTPYILLPIEILSKVGVFAEDLWHLNQAVVDFIGASRMEELQENYDFVSKYVAAMQFASAKFDPASLEHRAASYLFSFYVLEDKFTAGYLLRDLEVLIGNIERNALREQSRLSHATKKSGETSSTKRRERINALLDELQRYCRDNPEYRWQSEKTVIETATKIAAANNPKLWKQGRGQADEYAGEIRRGEHGDEQQEIYLSLFPR